MKPMQPLACLAAALSLAGGCAARLGTNSSAWAQDGPLCLQSCQSGVRRIPFSDVPEGAGFAEKPCTSRFELTSIFLCLRLYCVPLASKAAYGEFYETCLTQAGVHIPPLDIVAKYTREQIGEMERVYQDDAFSPDEKVDHPMIPSSALFAAWFATLDAWKYVSYYHYHYGLAMVYFWAAVIAFGAGYRLFSAISYKINPKIQSSNPSGTVGAASRWIQRNITLPATFGHRCAQNIWWCTIPTRIQTLTLVAFTLLNIVFSIHGYRIVAVNLYFPGYEHQILRYVSDRTGIISFANFPIIWLFGMRNNVAMWLTGWDFGAYNNFHRWVARIATVQAVVHSVGYTILVLQGGWPNFVTFWTKWWWVAGELATVFMCLLLAFSVYWMRRKQYELFLVVHIVMSAIILGTMLGHVSIFSGRYDPLFWISLLIWAFDRVLRVVRLLVFKPKSWSSPAFVTYNESSNIVRLQIPAEERVYKIQPGTFYYLSVLDVARNWESHPFTVSTVREGNFSEAQPEQMPLLEATAAENQHIEETEGKGSSDSPFMTFLIRPYDSFTERLRKLAVSKAQSGSSVRVLVDGPYGSTLPLQRFSHVVFIVGGSGVVLPLSYLRNLTHQATNRPNVTIHWAVREPAFARDVVANDLSEALDNDEIFVHTYGSTSASETMGVASSNVEEHTGRPDAHSIVASMTAEPDIESLAVVACGPAGMADDSRRAVVDALAHAPFAIEYFEEHFTW